MKLKVKFLKWSAGLPVAMLNDETARKLGVRIRDRISIKFSSKELLTTIDTVKELIKEDEIGVSLEIKKRLNLRLNQCVDVNLASSPRSLNFIKKKLNKGTLSQTEIYTIVKDIVDNSLSESEIALFVSATYKSGMSMKEIIFLINAILKNGKKLILKDKFIADKHCVGGIAGNRTTPIVVSICTSAGLTMPKNSSRAITSAAGTADVIETVSRVDFSVKEIKKIIAKTNACLVWGGGLGFVPADSKIIQVENQLNIDSEPLLLSSIMSKKLAVNNKYILIDIPYGKFAKVNKQKAIKLKRKFEQLGRYFHKELKCVLTKGEEPIGNGIGPALELIDVVKVLDTNQDSPKDLEKKSLFLSAQLLELSGKAKKGEGAAMAKEILYSGRAFKKFKEIIKAQNGSLKKINKIFPPKFKKDILSKRSGKILKINNKKINSLARVVGCPADKSSGLYLYFHVGDKIKEHDKILTIYAESKSRLKESIKFYKENKIIKIR